MDPMSITAFSFTLAKLCGVVGWELRKFIDDTRLVGTTINALLQDVENFGKILNQIKDTINDQTMKDSIGLRGQFGSHWNDLQISLSDAENTLKALESTVCRVNKSVSVLDSTRRVIRLKEARDEIAVYQQEIQSYKDTIQVSLQTIILWHQTSIKESSDKVHPKLDQLQATIRRLGFNMNSRLAEIEAKIGPEIKLNSSEAAQHNQISQFKALDNLRNCLKSAASIVSSASTIYGHEVSGGTTTVYGSDFGDVFPPRRSGVIDWIHSNEITEVEEISNNQSISTSPEDPVRGIAIGPLDDWDSDEEEELEKAQALFTRGTSYLNRNNMNEAENDFRNALNRLSKKDPSQTVSNALSSLRLNLISALVIVLKKQRKWDDALKLLKESLTLRASHCMNDDLTIISDTIMLSEVLLEKGDLTEALLYGRQAYRALRKQDPPNQERCVEALRLLVRICQLSGNKSDAEAYLAILQQKYPPHEGKKDQSEQGSKKPIPLQLANTKNPKDSMIPSDVSRKSHRVKKWPWLLQPKMRAHLQTLKGHSNWVRAVSFSPDGSTVASASDDGTVRLWDTRSGAELQTLKGHSNWVRAVAFSPDGSTIASASGDMTVRLWDAESGAERQMLKGHSHWVRAVAFSPDGSTIASASGDTTVRLWDAQSGAERQTLKGHSNWVRAVAFSPDGSTIASASDDMTVRIWDTQSGAELQTLKGHKNWVLAVAFSPDGSIIASASGDTTVRTWDTQSGATRQILKGHSNWIWAVAFSPDGSTIASASKDKTVRLWDAQSGAERQTLKGHTNSVQAVSFSPNGSIIVSASDDMTVKLWDAQLKA